jgi:hypothetical protein
MGRAGGRLTHRYTLRVIQSRFLAGGRCPALESMGADRSGLAPRVVAARGEKDG